MKEHTIEVTLRFTSREFPDEPEWSGGQWRHEIVSLLENEHRGLSEYKSCRVISFTKDGEYS